MAARQTSPFLFIFIAVALIAGVVALLQAKPDLYRKIFVAEAKPADGLLSVSGEKLARIVDEVRKHQRDKWVEELRKMHAGIEAIEAKRDSLYKELAESRFGQAYVDEFKRLTASHHGRVGGYSLDGDDYTMHDVYQAARDVEQRVNNAYRDIQGARNALNLGVPAIDAVDWVKVVQPRRPELDAAPLEERIYAMQEFDRFKKVLMAGSSQLEAIGKNVEILLSKAGLESGDNPEGGVQTMADLAIGSIDGETLRPDEVSLDGVGTGDDYNCVAGRAISRDSLQQHNIFLDKWYVIGPFENRMRRNLDAKFLPETVIDLDNTTIGKDNKEIGWEYWIFSNDGGKPRIEPVRGMAPRGSIFYGWTEVYAEEAGKYWVALGSDDYGKLWVNEELVWQSKTTPKPYSPSEDMKEIELKQGVNELLFRCENNGGTMGWSVIFLTAFIE